MNSIVEQLYEKRDSDTIKSLYVADESTHPLLLQSIGKALFTNKNIVIGQELNQLCLMFGTADFAKDDNEKVTVAVMFYSQLKVDNPLPSLTEDRGIKFASKTIVSLSLFYHKMNKLFKHHGAPKPDYYRNIAKLYLRYDKKFEVSDHFEMWENFVRERMDLGGFNC